MESGLDCAFAGAEGEVVPADVVDEVSVVLFIVNVRPDVAKLAVQKMAAYMARVIRASNVPKKVVIVVEPLAVPGIEAVIPKGLRLHVLRRSRDERNTPAVISYAVFLSRLRPKSEVGLDGRRHRDRKEQA